MTVHPPRDLPRRRDHRLRAYDYSTPAAYFVTMRCHEGLELLGEICGDTLQPTAVGSLVDQAWNEIPRHHPGVRLDAWVVMPNHVHGVLWIGGPSAVASPPVLGTVVRSFKASASRRAASLLPRSCPRLWQRNYWDRVVRDDDELFAIREYIRTNPATWSRDRLNGRAVTDAGG